MLEFVVFAKILSKRFLVAFNEVLRGSLQALILNYNVPKLFYLMKIVVHLKRNSSVFFHGTYVAFECFSSSLPNRFHMLYSLLHDNLKYFECNSKSYQIDFRRSDLSLYLPVRRDDLNKCHNFMEGLATNMD